MAFTQVTAAIRENINKLQLKSRGGRVASAAGKAGTQEELVVERELLTELLEGV